MYAVLLKCSVLQISLFIYMWYKLITLKHMTHTCMCTHEKVNICGFYSISSIGNLQITIPVHVNASVWGWVLVITGTLDITWSISWIMTLFLTIECAHIEKKDKALPICTSVIAMKFIDVLYKYGLIHPIHEFVSTWIKLLHISYTCNLQML